MLRAFTTFACRSVGAGVACFLLCAPAVVARAVPPAEAADGFVALFNGRDTEGWTTAGNISAWKAVDGELHIDKAAGNGWWLRTVKQYRDFDLRLEFNVPKGGNSGVGIRGSTTGDPAFTGFEVQIFDSHGQQPAVNVCGAVYGAIAPASVACKPAGEWNEYRILLVGDTLNVWLNGAQIHKDEKLDDRGFVHDPKNKSPLRDRLTTGHIALQDHGDPVRFRNLRIKDLSPDPDTGGWVPLFNGRDTTGWFAKGGGTWKVEDGTLVGRDGPGHLFSEAKFADLDLRAHVKVNTRGNGGLYFRTVPRPEDPNTWPLGYEAQVDQHDPKNFTGCIYDKAWGPKLITRDNAWIDYRIRAVGDSIQTWINGVPMVNAKLADFRDGHIALQTHHQGNIIMWKDIAVRDLTKNAAGGGENQNSGGGVMEAGQ